MPSYTTSAFVVQGGFGPDTREHPAVAFAEEGLKVFDSRDHSTIKEWITEDFSVTNPDGSHDKNGGQKAFERAKTVHDKFFTAYRHVPTSIIAIEVDNGYKTMTHGCMYANILAVSSLDPAKVSDPDGTKWDLMVPAFSEWDLVKDANAKHHGLLVKHAQVTFDKSEILKAVQAKGLNVDVSSWLSG